MRRVLVFASVVAGCSGGPSSGSTTGTDGIAATCGDADTSVVEGTLDGKPANVTGTTKSWSWVNIGNPSRYDGSFEGGSIHLEWSGTTPNGRVTPVTIATVTLDANAGTRTFQSGSLLYDSPDDESILKTTLTFDTGTVTVCMRKSD